MKSYSNLSERHGDLLVKRAKKTVYDFLVKNTQNTPDKEFESEFSFESGVFVTITRENHLRGCIGFPMPHKKLYEALDEAAIAAATQDPRFLPITEEELDDITFEVTVLTPPILITANKPEEYLQEIRVGRDGLIVKNSSNSGLLLPQVPVEYGWNAEEFLRHTCQKAGLEQDCWKRHDTEVLRFEGIIFKETEPNGKVIRADTS